MNSQDQAELCCCIDAPAYHSESTLNSLSQQEEMLCQHGTAFVHFVATPMQKIRALPHETMLPLGGMLIVNNSWTTFELHSG